MRGSLEYFVREFWAEVPGAGILIWNWHLSLFCDELEQISGRVFRNEPKAYDLVLNVSPGTSKSTIWSILFPCWVWTRMPHARIMTASHTDSLVLDLANKARTVIKSEKYRDCFPEIELKEDQDTKGYYANTLGGDRYTCTVAGKSPMGFHAHFIITDDPIDPKKVLSELERATAKEFISAVLPTRKVDKSVTVTVLVMQRLGVGDPTEVMLTESKKEGAANVRHICLPAELEMGVGGEYLPGNCQPAELAANYVDGLMDPNRLGRDVLREYRARGVHYYSTQFLQHPYAQEGGMFNAHWFNKRVQAAPYDAVRVRSWDRACLVAGTMIETLRGIIPIEFVVVGDYVLTRSGYRRVKWSGVTKLTNEVVEVIFSNGSVLVGTPDHLTWTSMGWRPLSTLDGSCYNTALVHSGGVLWQSMRQFDSMGLCLKGDAALATKCGGGTPKDCCFLIPFTEQLGVNTTEVSPLTVTSITKMGTGTTTTSRIWSVYRERNTINFMGYLWNGIKQTRGNSTRNDLLKLNVTGGSRENLPVSFANIVGANFGRNTLIQEGCGSALSFVGVGFGMIGTQLNARFVGNLFLDGLERGLVPANAPGNIGDRSASIVASRFKKTHRLSDFARRVVEQNGSIPVYDLEVEDAHEFFANGILVHNSTENGGCYTAGVLMAKDAEGNYYVEDVVHGQWEPGERNARMKAAALKDRSRYGPKREPKIEIEDEGGSAGKDANMGVAKVLDGFNVSFVRVSGSKDVRAEPWASQLAAGNVYIVDNGSWDVAGYVQEHVAFKPDPGKRLGKYKDQVDSSSAAYNRLSQMTRSGPVLRSFAIASQKKKHPHLILLTDLELMSTVIEDSTLLVHLNGDEIPGHAIIGLADHYRLRCEDLDPAELQKEWNEDYAKQVLQREDAKRLWAFLLKKREPSPSVYVFHDKGDRVARSICYAVADVLRIPRATIFDPSSSSDNVHGGKAPNQYVYDMIKAGRGMVV